MTGYHESTPLTDFTTDRNMTPVANGAQFGSYRYCFYFWSFERKELFYSVSVRMIGTNLLVKTFLP